MIPLLKLLPGGDDFRLISFEDKDSPRYAFLSHAWDKGQEFTYQDLMNGTGKDKSGFKKIQFCGKQAARDGLQYFWVDTCCIDTSSEAEVQRAADSMFRWYREATGRYVYLSDVSNPKSIAQRTDPSELPPHKKQKLAVPATSSSIHSEKDWEQEFKNSRWFKCGWAHQELLAPASVEFFSRNGVRLGDKNSLSQRIHEITGIPVPALQGSTLSGFDMSLVYGEEKADALRRLREEIGGRGGALAPPRFHTIPFRDPFVNRGGILDQITKRCSEPAGRVALVGLGGVGKSQLAIELAYSVVERGTRVFWVDASTRARVEESFRTIADAVKLPGRERAKANIPHLLYSWLSQETNGRWIMILDSADDAEVLYGVTGTPGSKPLASYLPQGRNGSILITTRNKGLAHKLIGHNGIIEVGTMVEAEALSLLETKLGTTKLSEATQLVETLEYNPLAINQAAGYIRARAPRSSLKKYMDDFREGERERAKLLGHDGRDLRRDGSASNAVCTTWQISYWYILSEKPSAADLLSLMSFFNRQGIPKSVLKPSDPTVNIAREKSQATSKLEDDVAILQEFCLISANESKDEFKMHGLVQLLTRGWLETNGFQEKFKEQYLTQLEASFPRGDYENWLVCRKLFAHVEAAIDYQPAEHDMEKTWATLMFKGAWYAWRQGRYDVAERMARKAKMSREKLLGEEDKSTLDATSLLATVVLRNERWNEAEGLLLQVTEARKERLGADHPDTLSSMHNLAWAYKNQGRWKYAEELFMQAIEGRKKTLGADHLSTLSSMSKLASTYRKMRQWKDAEELDVQVVEGHKKTLGADHPTTLSSMNNLASTYENQGRGEDAGELFKQVIEGRKKTLGADHPDTLSSMNNLASTCMNLRWWNDAEELLKQVIEGRNKTLGADHPDTLSSMVNLGLTYRKMGQWKDADELDVRVMEARRSLGPIIPTH